jgi:hypothetical protein
MEDICGNAIHVTEPNPAGGTYITNLVAAWAVPGTPPQADKSKSATTASLGVKR